MSRRVLGTDPETGHCLDCAAGDHGMIRDGRCVCCGVTVPTASVEPR